MRCILIVLLSLIVIPLNVFAYDVYADKNNLSAEQVLEKDEFFAVDVWKSFGATKDVYWILLDELEVIDDDQFWLFIENGALDNVEVFNVGLDNTVQKKHHVGDSLIFTQRPVEHRHVP